MPNARINKTGDAEATADTTTEADVSAATDAGAALATSAPEPFIVDGQEVSEEAYYKAAEGVYDVARLRDMNYRPAISTKKHGEQ